MIQETGVQNDLEEDGGTEQCRRRQKKGMIWKTEEQNILGDLEDPERE